MTPVDVVLAAGDAWTLLGPDGETRQLKPRERLSRPAMVVMSFPGAVLGELRFEGKPTFARAMVERHVRMEGWIEGPSHVVIHRNRRLPDGAQVLYTAVPLAAWQDGMEWASRQSDHCMIVLPGQLLAAGAGGRVLRHGRHLMAFVDSPRGLVYEDVFASGDGHDDLTAAATRLGRQLVDHPMLRSGEVTLDWLPLSRSGVDQESDLVDAMQQEEALSVELLPGTFVGGRSDAPFDGLAEQLNAQPAMNLANPVPQRLAWLAEKRAPMAMALIAVLALGLLAGGWQARQVAAETQGELTTRQAEIDGLREAIGNGSAPPDWVRLESVAGFVQQLVPGSLYAPVPVVEQIRAAVPEGVSIHRITLEDVRGDYRLRVDGRASESGQSGTISRFVAALNEAGWEARSLDPAGTSRGSFSYRLIAREDRT
ncbi:hypothetical protein IC757_14335 [Wenzhouxiangella sp. AB-CW3]|uniref:hypothetical protein n=1 Tax=Wenzhouxiangella sp. AB-CW3 TaxID=2771012 RepID=UPI00168AEDCE|nr:hypothetical protein [Wenzhouxiangella sp. AB-CW3]QOC22180.1 hypothetical protein IC757_14335 [Wenzhouxiangella sp. AB-CW3]